MTDSPVRTQPEPETEPRANLSLTEQVARMEKQLIARALQQHHYQQQHTADALGLSYHQLRAQLKKHNMLPLKHYRQQMVNAAQHETAAN